LQALEVLVSCKQNSNNHKKTIQLVTWIGIIFYHDAIQFKQAYSGRLAGLGVAVFAPRVTVPEAVLAPVPLVPVSPLTVGVEELLFGGWLVELLPDPG